MIDQGLKIYDFILLIEDTLEHGKGFGATAEVVSNYGRYTPTALGGCPNRARKSLRHDNSRGEFVSVSIDFTLTVNSYTKLSSGQVISISGLIKFHLFYQFSKITLVSQ